MAEADGNRTRQRQRLPFNGFEDRAGHQAEYASRTHTRILANIGAALRADSLVCGTLMWLPGMQ